MKALSASIEVPADRLIWLCEGLAWTYPDVKEYKRVLSIAKGSKRLAMAGEYRLAFDAVELIETYMGGWDGNTEVRRKTVPLKKAFQRQMGEGRD